MLDFLWKPKKKLPKSEIDNLKEIWNNIDPDLKKIINEKMQLFIKHLNITIIFNEIGICQLIKFLNIHGFEITKKGETNEIQKETS